MVFLGMDPYDWPQQLYARLGKWMTSGALLDFAERSRVQREPRSACNPLSLKAVPPADRCKTTERRKTIKHVMTMQALTFYDAQTATSGRRRLRHRNK